MPDNWKCAEFKINWKPKQNRSALYGSVKVPMRSASMLDKEIAAVVSLYTCRPLRAGFGRERKFETNHISLLVNGQVPQPNLPQRVGEPVQHPKPTKSEIYFCKNTSLSNHGGGWLGALKLDGSFRAWMINVMVLMDCMRLVQPTSMICANLFSILSSRGALQSSSCAPLPILGTISFAM